MKHTSWKVERPLKRSLRLQIASLSTMTLLSSSVLATLMDVFSIAYAGSSTTTCNGLPATIVGVGGDETINGTNKSEVIVAVDAGHKIVNGVGGNDTICTGDGNDLITTGNGRNWIDSGGGHDTVVTGNNIDTIRSGAGNDVLRSGHGNDSVDGGSGNDALFSGDGFDSMDGGAGIDYCDTWPADTAVNCEGAGERGVIIVIEDAVPDDPEDFHIFGAIGSFFLDDDADGTLSNTRSVTKDVGTYQFKQGIPDPDWPLTSVDCFDPNGNTGVAGPGATVRLETGEIVTCTFTNTFIGSSSSSSSSSEESSASSSEESSESSSQDSSSSMSSDQSSGSGSSFGSQESSQESGAASSTGSSESNSEVSFSVSDESSASSSTASSEESSRESAASSPSSGSSSEDVLVVDALDEGGSSSEASSSSESSSGSSEGESSSEGGDEPLSVSSFTFPGGGFKGSHRGHGTNVGFAVANFLSALNGLTGNIAPGAFGGSSETPLSQSEINYLCSLKRGMAGNALFDFVAAIAKIAAGHMHRDLDFVIGRLSDPTLCTALSALLKPEPKKEIAAVPKAFPIGIDGLPVSSNATWNACIRGNVTLPQIRSNTDLDWRGNGRTCGSYYYGDAWTHPNLGITFTFARSPFTLKLPTGYIATRDLTLASAE